MGEAYYRLGQYDFAIQTLQTAIKNDPSYAYNYYYLGLTYKRTNNWNKYVEIAKKLKGMDTRTYNQLVNPEN
jgi:tetratricopeptide (TPR) repeat protein